MVPVVWKNLLSPAILVPKNGGSSCLQNVSAVCQATRHYIPDCSIKAKYDTVVFIVHENALLDSAEIICSFVLSWYNAKTPQKTVNFMLFM